MIDVAIHEHNNLDHDKIKSTETKYEINLKNKINTMSIKANNLLTGYLTTFDSVYSKLSQKLLTYLSYNIHIYSKVFHNNKSEDLFEEYFYNQFQKKIDEITSMHASLLDSTMSNLNNLIRFIETIDIMNKHSISCSFLEKNAESILQSWLLAKIDYAENKIDFSHPKLNDLFQNYLVNLKEIKIVQLSINNEGNKEKDIGFLSKRNETLEALYMIKCGDIDHYFSYCSDNCFFPIMKKLCLEECSIRQVNIAKYFPSLVKMRIVKPIIMQWNNQFFSSTLINLSITKGLIETDDFDAIMTCLINDKQICSSIEHISFKYNIITTINLSSLMAHYPDRKFKSLTELNLESNNIYSFVIDLKNFPKLRILSLIDNNLARLEQFICKNITPRTIVFTNKNLYLFTKRNSLELYCRLKNQLPQYDYPIKTLNLTTMFTKYNNLLNGLTLNCTTRLSLREINLSYCGLDTDAIIDFLTQNEGFFNLSKINLKGNFIDMRFFYLFNHKELNIYHSKLEEIILSNNLLDDEDFYLVYEFIERNANLKQINLSFNPFSNYYKDEKVMPQYEGQLFVFDYTENELKRPYDLIALLMRLEMMPKRKIDIDFHTMTKTMMSTSSMKKKNFCSKIVFKSALNES